MRNLLRKLWSDDSGAVVSTEYVMVTGLAVGAAGSGVVALRNAAIKQSEHLAETIVAAPYLPTPDEMRQRTVLPAAKQPQSATTVQCQQVVIVNNILPPSP